MVNVRRITYGITKIHRKLHSSRKSLVLDSTWSRHDLVWKIYYYQYSCPTRQLISQVLTYINGFKLRFNGEYNRIQIVG